MKKILALTFLALLISFLVQPANAQRAWTPADTLRIANVSDAQISPDGAWVLATGPDQRVYRQPLDGTPAVLAPGFARADQLSSLSEDARSAFADHSSQKQARGSHATISRHSVELRARSHTGASGARHLRS